MTEASIQKKHDGEEGDKKPHLDRAKYVPAYLVRLANAVSRGASRLYLKLFNIGVVEWRILSVLANAPGSTAQNISDQIDLDKASASRSVKNLETAGCITVRRDEIDQRSNRLFLTPKGESIHAELLKLAIRREETLLQGFAEAEKAIAIWFLQRMSANLGRLDELDNALIREQQSGHPAGEPVLISMEDSQSED